MKNQPSITLNTGAQMPQVGLGVWQAKGGDEVKAVQYALEAGYRHIDTAAIYKNEAGVGQAIADSGIPRDELFITTKLWNDDIRAHRGEEGLKTSLDKLQLDYVDLYLMHWPVDGGTIAWKQLEKLHKQGLAKAIGLSNYMPEHIEALMETTSIVPAVNQIEYHPYNQQQDVIDFCNKHNIAVTAWSPLMQGKFLDEAVFEEIAKPYGKTPAQVLLRWDLQRGVITIPKSVNESRIQENFDLFDFELSAADMDKITALDRDNGRFGPDPRNFDF